METGHLLLLRFPMAQGAIRCRVVAADLNHDGKFDLAVANWGDATISVLLEMAMAHSHNRLFTPTRAGLIALLWPTLAKAATRTWLRRVIAPARRRVLPESRRRQPSQRRRLIPRPILPATATTSWRGRLNGDGRPDFAAMSNASVIDVFLSQPTEQVTVSGIAVAGAGAHNVVASYGGDTNFSGSTSSPQSLTAAPVNTTLLLPINPPLPLAMVQRRACLLRWQRIKAILRPRAPSPTRLTAALRRTLR